MVQEQNHKNTRRTKGAVRGQPMGGAAGVDARCGVCSGEAAGREVEGSLPRALAVVGGGLPGPRLSMLSLRKLVGLKQRLEAGESLHISSAAGLISWRYNRRPENCPYLVADLYTGAFLAWLTEPEKTVLDAVLAEKAGKGVAA